ncbi:FAD-dependent oxidoreductase [Hoeflea sp. TYP-13]|uniref:oxidoreductase n=1 Tax=Hoeflea sp. TYP-13 TaxID=3230023 RepID=UPI0034C5F3FB
MRDARHDILFEPLQIGPVTTKNRFYQVPHCTGMGWQSPKKLAAMRGLKAEGGWGVVCTEYCSVHPTSDDSAYPLATLWDTQDIKAQALMTERVHEHGALAGVELWLGGGFVANFGTRIPPLGLQDRPLTNPSVLHPVQCRRIDKDDIRDLRRWHAEAAKRAVTAGFDIVYVYANHGYLLSQFLSAETNERTDEYGGSQENRTRIVRELIEETREAVGGEIAVATRFSIDPSDSETYDALGLLAEYPDLWDLTVSDYDIEMGVSRFVKEGAMVDAVAQAKSLTGKPVVAVGRFTSADTMAATIRSGAQDLIGAARPSIADPFLPNKIDEGRSDEIRECIGCNICYAHNSIGVPIRCTQNPTMGEEWRLGWHPERVASAETKERILVIGAGPAGLEAARVLGERGHDVMLAEGERVPGGRVTRESKLPGLSEWARVRDWRMGQIEKLPNVALYPESRLNAEETLGLEADHILVATGARWATDGIGRHRNSALECSEPTAVISADTVIDKLPLPDGRVMIFDDDHYYMGPVLALALRKRGHDVILVTPAGRAGAWGSYTEEIFASNAALIEAGVEIQTNQVLEFFGKGRAICSCLFSGKVRESSADLMIPLTRRIPDDKLFMSLSSDAGRLSESGVGSVRRIGDCEAPGTIAAAVHAGYRAAMELGSSATLTETFGRREHPVL